MTEASAPRRKNEGYKPAVHEHIGLAVSSQTITFAMN